MAYPGGTDWPTSVDSDIPDKLDGDVVEPEDFNYPDSQIITIQAWLGEDEDLIGNDGTSAHGPGGLVSPIADGGVAVKLAAKEDYTSGKLLSVGDDNDATYSEKFAIDYSGKIASDGLDVTADGALADPGHRDTVQAVTSASNEVEVDCRDGFVVYHYLTENTEVQAPSNSTNGAELTFIIRGNASNTVTFETQVTDGFWWNSAFPINVGSGYDLVVKFIYEATLYGWIEEWSNRVITQIV